jgi:RNA 2',3'-cyclic 3'-phosphodiesterase
VTNVQRLFFALWPGAPVREAVAAAAGEVARQQDIRGRRINPERYHLTLLYLGDLGPAWAARALHAAETVRAAPFDLVLDRLDYFYGAKVLWAGPTGPSKPLIALWLNLRAAMQAGNIPHERRNLAPHLTCLREVDHPLKPVAITPIVWPVREFVIIHSIVTGRAEYRILGRWPLTAAPDTQSGAGVKTGVQAQLWENAPGPDRQ